MPTIPFSLSPYKMMMFRHCPRQYRYHYVDGLYGLYHKPRPYHTLGTNVHRVLKTMFLSTNRQRTLDFAMKMLGQCWSDNHEGFDDEETERDYFNTAIEQLEWFCRTQDLTARPYMVEARHEVALSPELRLLGIIDRVDRNADGSLHVIDYKTGRHSEEIDELQLLVYALLLNRRFRHEIRTVSYLHLNGSGWQSFDIEQNQLEDTEDDILTAYHYILAEKQYAPRPNHFCTWCDFGEICDAPRLADWLSHRGRDEWDYHE